jgi:putative ABC transport system substrate-binding protein
MNRRAFIALFGGVASSWPLAVRAQQARQLRRLGVLMNVPPEDREGRGGIAALQQALQHLGWSESRNLQIDIRWGANDLDRQRSYAAELAALAPDVIVASGTLSVAAFQHVTHALPIVFVRVADPVGAGFVDNLARPGGELTGFMLFEYSLSGKWLQLLKQIAPGVARAAVLRDPANPSGTAQFAAIQVVAGSLGIEVIPVSDRDADEIDVLSQLSPALLTAVWSRQQPRHHRSIMT